MPRSIENPIETDDVNVRGTLHVLEAARSAGVKRVVFASSSSVYGESEQLPKVESHPTQPMSPYGVSKLAAEQLCVLYADNFGVPSSSLRYFTVYGPRQRPDMAFRKFLEAARDGRSWRVFGDGSQTRDFTFVGDAVRANLLAADDPNLCGIYNIGGDIVRELVEEWKDQGEYLRSHGYAALALETAEAAAELVHRRLRAAWGFADPPDSGLRYRLAARYQGKRYSFGYPACPDLADQRQLFSVLAPREIGVELTDGDMMSPEASVSAIVLHHPDARYFGV